jgi:hypothetical protein
MYNYRYVQSGSGPGLDPDSIVPVYGTWIRIRKGKNSTQNEKKTEIASIEQLDGFPTIETFMEIGNTSWKSDKKWYNKIFL